MFECFILSYRRRLTSCHLLRADRRRRHGALLLCERRRGGGKQRAGVETRCRGNDTAAGYWFGPTNHFDDKLSYDYKAKVLSHMRQVSAFFSIRALTKLIICLHCPFQGD